MKTVKACPRCGRIYAQHCWHDEREIMTKEMTALACLALLASTKRVNLDEAKEIDNHISTASKALAD